MTWSLCDACYRADVPVKGCPDCAKQAEALHSMSSPWRDARTPPIGDDVPLRTVLVGRKCGRCHRGTTAYGYDSCPSCVANLAKSLAEEMRKVRALETVNASLRKELGR